MYDINDNIKDYYFPQSLFQVIDKDGNVLETLSHKTPSAAYTDSSTLFPPLQILEGYNQPIESKATSTVSDSRVIKNFIRTFTIDKKYKEQTIYIQIRNGIDFQQNTISINFYSIVNNIRVIERTITVGTLAIDEEYVTSFIIPTIDRAERYEADIIYEFPITASPKEYDGNKFLYIPAGQSVTFTNFLNVRIRSSLYPTNIAIYNNTNKGALLEAKNNTSDIVFLWWEGISDPPTSGNIRTLLQWSGGKLDYSMSYNNNNNYSIITLPSGARYKRITGDCIVKMGDLGCWGDYYLSFPNFTANPQTVAYSINELIADLDEHTTGRVLQNTDFLDVDKTIGNLDVFTDSVKSNNTYKNDVVLGYDIIDAKIYKGKARFLL